MASGKTWGWLAGIASVLCALMLSVAVGGAPSWTGDATVVVFVAIAGVILLPYALGRRRPGRQHSVGTRTVLTKVTTAHDAKVLVEILAVLKPRDLEWLQSETFRSQWQTARLVPFRTLLDRARRHPDLELYDTRLDAALFVVLENLAAFLALHDDVTISDPIIAGNVWREVKGATTAARSTAENSAFEKRCRRLRASADKMLSAYDRLEALSR
jgi:hypothetical protein